MFQLFQQSIIRRHKVIKKKMIEFNTIRSTALKLTVKGGRITVMEGYTRSQFTCATY